MTLKQRTFKYWIKLYLYNNALILPIKRKYKGIGGDFLLLLCSPYIIFNMVFTIIYEYVYGFSRIEKAIEKEKMRKFKYELAVVTCSKDEAPYLIEWIEFYRIVGVNKIIFYDNESSDKTKELLEPYIKYGIVDYYYIKGRGQQLSAYNEALINYKNNCRWMAFIDMDEYIIPTDTNCKLLNVINDIVYKSKRGAAGVGINWATFGTSGHLKRPKGLITANFLRRADNYHWMNIHIKTICNPRMVKYYISPHYPLYIRGAYSVEEETGNRQYGWGTKQRAYRHLRINHYMTKSAEDFIHKCNRGLGDREEYYDYGRLKEIDYDDVTDMIALEYKDELESRIKSYPNIVD